MSLDNEVSIDIESLSEIDLRVSGVYPYARHKSTGLWCACYAKGMGDIKVWRPGEPVPKLIVEHAAAGGLFRSWNADFERIMIRDCAAPRYGWPVIPIPQWRDTMAEARAMSLPGALGLCAHAVGLQEGKDEVGRSLMLRMARPRGYDPVYGTPTWWDTEEYKTRLILYCKQDVAVEREIARRVLRLSQAELLVWMLTGWMNDRGVELDMPTVEGAQIVVTEAIKRLNRRLRAVTGGTVTSVTAVGRLADWLRLRGYEVEKLDKVALREMLRQEWPPAVREMLEIRRDAAKTSAAKLKAFKARADDHNRMRGSLLYHAASTGRWSSVGAQLHNVPREGVEHPDLSCGLLADGDIEGLELLHNGQAPLDIVSRSLRSMIVAAKGCELIVADYAQIEARGTAWLAAQWDLVEAFEQGSDVYCDMAERVFGRRVTAADTLERFIGKQLTLGCGYQMGWQKFADSCTKVADVVVDDELAKHAVMTWRTTNAQIVITWRELQDMAFKAVQRPGKEIIACEGLICCQVNGSFLVLELPSGRRLFYPHPRIEMVTAPWDAEKPEEEQQKRPAVVYQEVRGNDWKRGVMYGGKWMENIIQGLCRDLMAYAMVRLREHGWHPVLTVHDEVVCEEPVGAKTPERLVTSLCELPPWAMGFPIKAKGWKGRRYGKA